MHIITLALTAWPLNWLAIALIDLWARLTLTGSVL